jgi:hypothetical protein
LASALALVSGCCFGAPASLCTDACRTVGECRVRTERAGDGAYRCYAGSDAECAASEACAREGRCSVTEDGACVRPEEVASHACAMSATCRVWGGCHPREGFCEPQLADDCLRSLECRTQGRCELDADRHGCFASPAACAGTTGCEIEGLCTYEELPLGFGGQCRLGASGSCAGTLACRLDGRCAARPLQGCREGCRVFYCGRPEAPSAQAPCTEMHGTALLACEPDGRFIRNAAGQCAPLPR